MSFADVTRRIGGPAHRASGPLALTLGLLGMIVALPSRTPFPDRPPLGHTGGFGEPTCVRCHAGSDVNSGGGTLSLEGLPATYEPGQRYRFAVALERRGMRRAGFQLAVRFTDGAASGQAAGQLRVLDDRVQLMDSVGVLYAFHTSAGSALIAPSQATWNVEWTAPRDGGHIAAHVVANAANDDASELGDYVYADSLVSEPAR